MRDAPFVRFRFTDGVDDSIGSFDFHTCVVNDSEAGGAVAKEPVFFFERKTVVSPFVFVQSFAIADSDFVSSVREKVIAVFVITYNCTFGHKSDIPSVVDGQVVAGCQSESTNAKCPYIDAERKSVCFHL